MRACERLCVPPGPLFPNRDGRDCGDDPIVHSLSLPVNKASAGCLVIWAEDERERHLVSVWGLDSGVDLYRYVPALGDKCGMEG